MRPIGARTSVSLANAKRKKGMKRYRQMYQYRNMDIG